VRHAELSCECDFIVVPSRPIVLTAQVQDRSNAIGPYRAPKFLTVELCRTVQDASVHNMNISFELQPRTVATDRAGTTTPTYRHGQERPNDSTAQSIWCDPWETYQFS
jgi:hypothetical protein